MLQHNVLSLISGLQADVTKQCIIFTLWSPGRRYNTMFYLYSLVSRQMLQNNVLSLLSGLQADVTKQCIIFTLWSPCRLTKQCIIFNLWSPGRHYKTMYYLYSLVSRQTLQNNVLSLLSGLQADVTTQCIIFISGLQADVTKHCIIFNLWSPGRCYKTMYYLYSLVSRQMLQHNVLSLSLVSRQMLQNIVLSLISGLQADVTKQCIIFTLWSPGRCYNTMYYLYLWSPGRCYKTMYYLYLWPPGRCYKTMYYL